MTNIMLVDDYEIFREQIKSLQYWKNHPELYLSQEAADGVEALDMLRKKPVDILLTDIKMPKIDGLELLEYVRQEKLSKCVILLSEYADFEYARKGIVLGAFDYIVKPVTNTILSRVLGRALKFLLDEKKENEEFLNDSRIMAESILIGGNNFEMLIARTVTKCFDGINEDIVKGVVRLMDFARKVDSEVMEKYAWLKLLVSDIEEVCTRMIQASDKEIASALFENYMMELYVAIRNWYPSELSVLSQKAVEYILTHPFDKLTLTDVAEVCYVSNTYLSHSFKKDLGKSFVDYLTAFKMQIVKKFLTETEMSMTEIAEKLGYDDYKYMGRLFKKSYGFTLSDYKRMQT